MIGAIAGDIVGSVFEQTPIKTTTFPLFSKASRFTDDTVLSVAVADAILNGTDYATALKTFRTHSTDSPTVAAMIGIRASSVSIGGPTLSSRPDTPL